MRCEPNGEVDRKACSKRVVNYSALIAHMQGRSQGLLKKLGSPQCIVEPHGWGNRRGLLKIVGQLQSVHNPQAKSIARVA